jgi:hypothetical protein
LSIHNISDTIYVGHTLDSEIFITFEPSVLGKETCGDKAVVRQDTGSGDIEICRYFGEIGEDYGPVIALFVERDTANLR